MYSYHLKNSCFMVFVTELKIFSQLGIHSAVTVSPNHQVCYPFLNISCIGQYQLDRLPDVDYDNSHVGLSNFTCFRDKNSRSHLMFKLSLFFKSYVFFSNLFSVNVHTGPQVHQFNTCSPLKSIKAKRKTRFKFVCGKYIRHNISLQKGRRSAFYMS